MLSRCAALPLPPRAAAAAPPFDAFPLPAAACHVPHHRSMDFCAVSPSIADITSDLRGGQQHNARAAQSIALSLLEHDHDDA